MLASAWESLAGRSKQREDFTAARRIAEHAASMSKPTPEILTVLGYQQQQDHDFEAAELSYRRAVQGDPSLALAQNNLASLLTSENKDLDFALAAANKAASDPRNPNRPDFLETLANVQAKMGHPLDAANTLQTALQLRPDQPDWQIEVVKYLADGGQRDDARNALVRFERRPAGMQSLAPDLQERIRVLHNQLESNGQAASN